MAHKLAGNSTQSKLFSCHTNIKLISNSLVIRWSEEFGNLYVKNRTCCVIAA